MTEEQKQRIHALRRGGLGYKKIVLAVGISVNTVKSFCRNNELTAIPHLACALLAASRWCRCRRENSGSSVRQNAGRSGGTRTVTKAISLRVKPSAASIAAGKRFLLTSASIGNIAHTPAMWQSVFKAVMQMRKEQYRADMLYQVSLSVAKTMREKGLITADEYVEIDTMLLAKYQPYLGRLLSENA